jgi:hypothetical protein
LSAEGFAEHELEPGVLVWFTPGVIHRLINDDHLEILVVMQHSRLPEAGDTVLTFPSAVLEDPDAYAEHASLGPSETLELSGPTRARQRRDLAVDGFTDLRRRYEADGEPALHAFYTLAAQRVSGQIATWRALWQQSVATAQATGAQLDSLAAGRPDHLLDGAVHSLQAPPEPRLGMCGRLNQYLPEGVRQ